MTQPVPYERLFNFADYAVDNPLNPYDPSQHDDEFDAVKENLDGLNTNIALLQRDDGLLRNLSVHPNALSEASRLLIAGWNIRGDWATATNYAAKDFVEYGDAGYVALSAHTSSTFAFDLASGYWLLIESPPGFVTIRHDGAIGDGVADDSTEVALTLVSFGSRGGLVYVVHGTYKTGAMALSDPVHMRGDGGVYTAFNPALASINDDTLTIGPSVAFDHTLMRIEGIALHDPTTGQRIGRYGVFADTQTAGKQLPKFTLRDSQVGQGSHATPWGFYHLNVVANNANGGMYGALFQNLVIKGGMRFENSGDSNSVVHSIISGSGIGLWIGLAPGASLLEGQALNITNSDGAVRIESGSRFRLLGINAENSAAGAAANNNAAVFNIAGGAGAMYGGVIKESLISAFGATDATMLLRLRNCRGTLVEDNVFLSGAAGLTVGIDIGSDCQDVRIGANAYNASVTTKVVDAGVGTMGVLKTAALQNSWVAFAVGTSTLKYIKSSDGMVHVLGVIKNGTTANGTLIATLPAGFRPTEILRVGIMVNNAGTPQLAEMTVESDGSLRINFVLASGQVNINFHFPAANLADAVSLE